MTTVGLFNPSSPSATPVNINLIKDWFQRQGLPVICAEHLFNADRFLAGTDEERAQDIHDLFSNPKVDLLIALKGGYGSGRLLDLLDYDLIKKHPKPLIGFSDTTALQLGLYAKTGLISYTGLSPRRDITETGVDMLIEQSFKMYRADKSFSVALQAMGQPQTVKGTLIGGTLSLVDELIGTPYQPDFTDKILFLEDVAEEPYKIDRMLTHLRLVGVFNQVKAVLFGDFYKCVSSDKNDGTMQDVLNDLHARVPNTPMYQGLNYGHGPSRLLLPIGLEGTLTEENVLFFQYK